MPSQLDIPAFIGEFFSRRVSDYCANAGSDLVIYEYFITLGREVELFWKGEWTGAAVLFFFNRYLSLIVNIYGLAGDAHMSAQICAGEEKGIKIIDIMQYLPWAVFSTLRALALSRSYPLATFVFCLSIVPIPINFTHFAKGFTGVIDPVAGLCVGSDHVSSDLSKSLTIISRTCLIAADLLLVCITWANLYKRGGLRHSLEMNRFIAVLLLDGTMYFVVLLILNTIHLTLSMLSVEYAFQNVSYVTQFSEPITTILISRFLLDLQSAKRKACNPQGTTTLTLNGGGVGVGAIVFERVIGSLGSSLDIHPHSRSAEGEDGFGFKDSFDFDGHDHDHDSSGLRTSLDLTIQVGDVLSAKGGKSDGGPDSGVEMEMTLLSSSSSSGSGPESPRGRLPAVAERIV